MTQATVSGEASGVTRRQVPVGILCGLVGFAVNMVGLELFFGVDFLFGSVAVMLALLLSGSIAGVIAGTLAALCTWFQWHHPWAVLSFTGEALFAAWWLRRRSRDVVTADIVYWACLGAPLIWFSYHHLLGMAAQATLLVMLKQGINGIMNTFVAAVAVQLLRYRSPGSEELLSLRLVLSTTIMTFVLVPALSYLGLDTWSRLREGEAGIVIGMQHTAERSRAAVRTWLDTHYRSVITLAELAGDPEVTPASLLQQRTDTLKAGSHDFLRMAVLDRNAVTVAVSPAGEPAGRYRGIDMSDRPYIPILRATKKPAVTDLVAGRLGEPVVILPMAAPILRGDELTGFAIGAVDPAVLRPLLMTLNGSAAQRIILVDRLDRVVAATDPALSPLAPYRPPSGWLSRPLRGGVVQLIPAPGQVPNPMKRWSSARYLMTLPLGPDGSWKVIVESSPVAMLATLTRQSITSFGMLFALIVVTALFARLASNRLLRPLFRLQQVTADLPRQIAVKERAVSWPESGIGELQGLIVNFREMAAELSRYVHDLHALNDNLEERVTRRTADLQEKSARLEALLNSLPDLVFFKDTAGAYLTCNVNLAREFGCSQDAVAGATDDDFFEAETAQNARQNDRVVLETGTIRTLQESGRYRDGRGFQVETVRAPLVLSSGEIIGLVGIARDITDRLRHEQELVEARTAAEAAARAKSAFLATMSHELRTPLNAILGLTEMLQEGIMGEISGAQRKALASVRESGAHLLAIINDILDLTQIEADRLELRLQAVDPAELCALLLQKVRRAAEAKQIRLDARLVAPLPTLESDPRRLRQIIGNLLANAVKFTPTGGQVSLTVTGDRERGEVRFVVADSGIGISPDDRDKVFQPFYQVDSRLSRQYEGAGLGLTIAARLAELLGGRMEVESMPGEGSRFSFILPARSGAGAPEEQLRTTGGT